MISNALCHPNFGKTDQLKSSDFRIYKVLVFNKTSLT